MVEFAIVTAFIFVPMIFGVIEYGRLAFAKDMIVAAAREGVRYAAVHGTEAGLQGDGVADSASVADTVKARTQLSPIVVSARWNQQKNLGDTVTVTVTYVYTPIVRLPFFPASKTIVGRSRQIVLH